MVIVNFLTAILNFIFPPRCYLCNKFLEGEDGLCFECLSKINFISKPRCEICGFPFEFSLSSKNHKLLCPNCIKKAPKFDKCISAVRYDEISKKIILPFKHCDKTLYAKFMAKLMNTVGHEIISDSDIIIPVPIHLSRMLKRKYNQASLIARLIAKQNNKTFMYYNLIRVVATQSQGHLSPAQRKKNVSSAFTIRHPELLKGKNVLLIDDVYTTGATVNECAKILKFCGVKKVYVLTFARVAK